MCIMEKHRRMSQPPGEFNCAPTAVTATAPINKKTANVELLGDKTASSGMPVFQKHARRRDVFRVWVGGIGRRPFNIHQY